MSTNSPILKQGWLKKQSRSGLIKKWQTRYFVINSGVIYYYQEKIDTFPFGEIQKGDLPLRGASIVNGDKKYTDKQIYIIAANSKEDNNMLIEAESIDIANEWKRSILEHIKFSEAMGLTGTPAFGRSSTGGSIDGINSSYRAASAEGTGGNFRATAAGGNSPVEGNGDGVAAGADGNSGGVSPAIWGTPRAGWVVKVLRNSSGEKIFINVCEHEDVFFQPVTVGFNKWPYLVMAPGRKISDGGGEVMVYDAVVHPNVIALCNKEATHKDAVCLRVLRLLKKNFNEQVDSDYKLPKISKRYKGEPQPVLLVPEGQNSSGKKSRFGFNKHKSISNQSSSSSSSSSGGSGVVVEGQSVEEKAALAAAASIAEPSRSRTKTNKPFSLIAAPNMTNGQIDDVGDTRESSIYQRSVSYQPPDSNYNNGNNKNNSIYNSTNRQQGGGGGGSLSGMFPAVDDSAASNRLTNNNLDRDSQFARTNTFTPEVSSTSGGQQTTAAYSRWSAVAKRASLNPKVAAVNAFANTVGGMDNIGDKRSLSSGTATSPLKAPLLQQSGQQQGGRSLSAPEGSGMATGFRRFIPYNIVRNNGTIVKQAPDKSAPGKVLKQGSKVLVLARKVMSDGLAWLKTTDGWIVEKNYAGSVARALAPAQHGQPIGAKIVSTRFEDSSEAAAAGRESMVKKVSMKDDGSTRITTDQSEYTMRPSNSGWNVFGASSKVTSYQTRFTVDIMYPENAVIRISRTYADVSTLRDALLNFPDRMIKDRTLKAGDFPIIEDGNDEMVEDVNELLYVVEGVENWLSKVLSTITVDRCKCKALLDFLTPKDMDIYMMEKELMADGGLCGSHGGGGGMEDN